jgi:hypothetical protein
MPARKPERLNRGKAKPIASRQAEPEGNTPKERTLKGKTPGKFSWEASGDAPEKPKLMGTKTGLHTGRKAKARGGQDPASLEIVILLQSSSTLFLIPKLRGDGYLKTPYGHHLDDGLSRLETEIGEDIFGLDGHLEIHTGHVHFKNGSMAQGVPVVIERFIKPIAAYYGMKWRIARPDEFWTLHPIVQGKF